MVRRATNSENFEMDFKVCSQSRKFEFNVFSVIHLNGITFNENKNEDKVFKIVQIMNNILGSIFTTFSFISQRVISKSSCSRKSNVLMKNVNIDWTLSERLVFEEFSSQK